ncbi:DUF6477 family protein [Pseudorhodobacter turbinis]|uniref:DUF6477 family protein n=1 Tax=Pseudorhodobacter turbinis TaxID=2500533 RepID=UPI001F0CE3B1|nr:DUF6477 family protein [Pseudorhodobacter turbinis]
MSDISTILANLRRPRLLIRAARHGIQDYRRDRDLRRLINAVSPPLPRGGTGPSSRCRGTG